MFCLEIILYAYSAFEEPGSSLVARCKIQFGEPTLSTPLFFSLLQLMRTTTYISVTQFIPLILSAGGGSRHLVAWPDISEGIFDLSLGYSVSGSRRGEID